MGLPLKDPDGHTSVQLQMLVCYSIVFMDMLGFGICLPLVPYLLKEIGGGSQEMGFFLSTYAVAQAFGSCFWGRMSDSWGRKPVLLCGLLGSAAAFCVLATSRQLHILIFARALSGLSGGTMTAAAALIADLTTTEERTRGQANLGTAQGVGFIFGPILGGVFYRLLGFNGTFWVPVVLALAVLVAGYMLLEEPRRAKDTAVSQEALLPTSEPERALVERNATQLKFGFGICCFVIFADYFAFSGTETVLPYIASDLLNWGPAEYTLVFLFFGLSLALTQMLVTPKLTARFGAPYVMCAGFAVRSFGILTIVREALESDGPIVVIAAMLIAAGGGMVEANVNTVITRIADELLLLGDSAKEGRSKYGTYLGIRDAIGMSAIAISPTVSGALYRIVGIRVMFMFFAISLLALGGGYALVRILPPALIAPPSDQAKVEEAAAEDAKVAEASIAA